MILAQQVYLNDKLATPVQHGISRTDLLWLCLWLAVVVIILLGVELYQAKRKLNETLGHLHGTPAPRGTNAPLVNREEVMKE